MPRRLSILLGVSPTKPHTRTGTQSDSLPTAAQPARQYAHQALRKQLVRNNTTGATAPPKERPPAGSRRGALPRRLPTRRLPHGFLAQHKPQSTRVRLTHHHQGTDTLPPSDPSTESVCKGGLQQTGQTGRFLKNEEKTLPTSACETIHCVSRTATERREAFPQFWKNHRIQVSARDGPGCVLGSGDTTDKQDTRRDLMRLPSWQERQKIAHSGGQQPPCHEDTRGALRSHLDGEDPRPPTNSQHLLASCVVKPRGTERLKGKRGEEPRLGTQTLSARPTKLSGDHTVERPVVTTCHEFT
ncbi:uncharacterized protein [Eschrichtius robustus]|uniref:uncharacterized protein n=1 Tax=Eschrichtius robustus TaxID=9764 RepID=UPI0035BFFE36